jgi:hypothetical protein
MITGVIVSHESSNLSDCAMASFVFTIAVVTADPMQFTKTIIASKMPFFIMILVQGIIFSPNEKCPPEGGLFMLAGWKPTSK